MENNYFYKKLNEDFNEINNNYINNNAENKITFSYFAGMGDNAKNREISLRLAYKYEENGQIKYAYTPSFSGIYNEAIK